MYKDDLKVFYIPKRKGKRKIVTYKTQDCELYTFHDKVNKSLTKRLKQSIFAKAYIKKRSIVTNARCHMYNDIFLFIDIMDFFQSINHKKLLKTLYYEINKNHIQHFTLPQCQDLIESCSLSNKGLAIGLKPSPILANIYLKEFDGILYGFLKKLRLKNVIYTRYADDLVISYKGDNTDSCEIITDKIIELLAKYRLKVNSTKTKIINLNKSNHVKITGINITRDDKNNRVLSVGRKLKNELYNRTIKLCSTSYIKSPEWYQEAKSIRGLQSFVLAVEGKGYENIYSTEMINIVKNFGYASLKELIDNIYDVSINFPK